VTDIGSPIRFGIVGSGWRSEFFQRIAKALPERFEITGVVTRSAARGREVERAWDVPTYRTVEELVATRPKFVVVSVPREKAPETMIRLTELGVPALTETPPSLDAESSEPLHRLVADGAILQVAEQYHLSPLLRSQLAIAASGRLGAINQVLVGQCHDYHGVSILRRALGITFEDARITASIFRSPLTQGPDRSGDPTEERSVTAEQVTARFEFGDGRLGVYDFASEQYFSWIRRNRLLVRGERGEISDLEVSYLQDFRTPMFGTIHRIEAGQGGNLEGQFLRGLILGDEWVFTNPFLPGRLSDDEIAIAECLVRMSDHVDGGPPLYSLAEASQDNYLALLMQEAALTGEPVRSRPQVWAEA
jgi:predicted dehydrogenase